MDIKRLETILKTLGEKKADLNLIAAEADSLKANAVLQGDEPSANLLWVYKTVIEIHKFYNQAFLSLKGKKYNDGWNLLERAEIEISFLKPHLHLVKYNYKMSFIEANVRKLQSLFPYRLFASSEILSLEEKCSICDKIISVRNPCGHAVGQLYMGEMCFRVATRCEFLGTALVENPVNKYSVLFEESADENFRDKEQFGNLNYLLDLIKNPYESWALEISHGYMSHDHFRGLLPTDRCPCNSGENYMECCLLEDGVHYFHFQFNLNAKAISRLKSKIFKKRK